MLIPTNIIPTTKAIQKTPQQFPLLLLAAIALALTGCADPPKDISTQPQIQELHLIGRCLLLKTDASLVQVGPPYRHLAILTSQMSNTQPIGTVKKGTRLRVIRIIRAPTYFDGFFEALKDLPIARIETGEHAGKEVNLWWPAIALPKAGEIYEPYEDCPHDTNKTTVASRRAINALQTTR